MLQEKHHVTFTSRWCYKRMHCVTSTIMSKNLLLDRMTLPHIMKFVSCTSSNLLHHFCCLQLRAHGYPNKYVGFQPCVNIDGVCRPCLGVCSIVFPKVPTCVATLYGCLGGETSIQKVGITICFLVPTMPCHYDCMPSTLSSTIIFSMNDSWIFGMKRVEYGWLLGFTNNSATNAFRKNLFRNLLWNLWPFHLQYMTTTF
jgi:hypothetical protein